MKIAFERLSKWQVYKTVSSTTIGQLAWPLLQVVIKDCDRSYSFPVYMAIERH
jgi:hypothetical protein